jgi:hypothetical protein
MRSFGSPQVRFIALLTAAEIFVVILRLPDFEDFDALYLGARDF